MIPRRFCRRGAELMHLQCWLWGQDVRCPAGNRLLRAGFERVRPPADSNGCTQYSLRLPGGGLIKLWGFGIYCGGEEQGAFVGRFDFRPRAVLCEDCWTPRGMTAVGRGATVPAADVLRALGWMSGYEHARLREGGLAARRVEAFGAPGVSVDADELAPGWEELAGRLETWIRCREQARTG